MSSFGNDASKNLASIVRQRVKSARFMEKNREKKESFQPDSDVNLLEWVNGERVAFFVWAYIRTSNCEHLSITLPGMSSDSIPYEKLKLKENPVSTRERLSSIKIWFREVEKRTSPGDAYKVMIAIRDEWLYAFNYIKQADWLEKNEISTRWLWERMIKNPLFNTSLLRWFLPANARERFLAINTALDIFLPEQWQDTDCITKYRNEFIARSFRAYRTHSLSVKDESQCQLNVKISKRTKEILYALYTDRGVTQASFIEWLILDYWQEGQHSGHEKEKREHDEQVDRS